MSDIEYSVITSVVIKSLDCIFKYTSNYTLSWDPDQMVLAPEKFIGWARKSMEM